jgi:hypothetical protein
MEKPKQEFLRLMIEDMAPERTTAELPKTSLDEDSREAGSVVAGEIANGRGTDRAPRPARLRMIVFLALASWALVLLIILFIVKRL